MAAPTFLGWGRTGLPVIPAPSGATTSVTFTAGDAPGPSSARVFCVLRVYGFAVTPTYSTAPAPWVRNDLYVGAGATGMGGYGISARSWTATKADLPLTVSVTMPSPGGSASIQASAFSVSACDLWDDQRLDGDAAPNSSFLIPGTTWSSPFGASTMTAPAGALVLAVGGIHPARYIDGLHPSWVNGFALQGYSDGWATGDQRGHYAIATRTIGALTTVTPPRFLKSGQPATGGASALLCWPIPRQPCFTLGGLIDAVGPSSATHRITVHSSTLPGPVSDYRFTYLYGVGGFSPSQFASSGLGWPLSVLASPSGLSVGAFAPGQGFAAIVTRVDGTGPMLSGAVVLRVQNLTTGVSEYVELTCTTLSPGGWTTTASGGGAGWRSGVRRGLRSG